MSQGLGVHVFVLSGTRTRQGGARNGQHHGFDPGHGNEGTRLCPGGESLSREWQCSTPNSQTTTFWIGLIAAEFPANRLVQILPLGKLMGSALVVWGIVLIIMAVVPKSAAILGLRCL